MTNSDGLDIGATGLLANDEQGDRHFANMINDPKAIAFTQSGGSILQSHLVDFRSANARDFVAGFSPIFQIVNKPVNIISDPAIPSS